MKILIKKDAWLKYGLNKSYQETLKNIAGKWVTVETKHLFANQFNTKNARIMAIDVEDIKGDVRIGKFINNYTGETYLKIPKNLPDEQKTFIYQFMPINSEGIALKEVKVFS